MTERDIIHQNGDFWVAKSRISYTVFRTKLCVSTSDSAYSPDADGLSLALARCNYLAKRYVTETVNDRYERQRKSDMEGQNLG